MWEFFLQKRIALGEEPAVLACKSQQSIYPMLLFSEDMYKKSLDKRTFQFPKLSQ